MASRKRIAVIGSGAAGLGAAFALKDVHDVVVFEKDARLGGHANTIDIPYRDGTVPVDTGFMVFNRPNYPNLCALFDHLGVESRLTDMSFGVSAPDGLEWCSYPPLLPLQLRNLARADFRAMAGAWGRFNARARADLAAGRIEDQALGQYLDQIAAPEAFRRLYLYPMGAAIWSSCDGAVADQPARTFLQFFENHGLLRAVQPLWRTVAGGSRAYVERLAALLGDRVRLNAEIVGVRANEAGAIVRLASGLEERFDEIVLACHCDQALSLLEDADAEERAFLGAIRYAPNAAVVHGDRSLLPRRRTAWAAWNYRLGADGERACVTYNMNRLQKLPRDLPVFITLNPAVEPAEDSVYARIAYDHPQFDLAAGAAQRRFNRIQGVRGIWYAGAWLGRGFHEDALRSGLRVALRLGGRVPWRFVDVAEDGGAWGARRVPHAEPALAAAQ